MIRKEMLFWLFSTLIIQEIKTKAMGCGAVETIQNNRHDQLSQNALQELLPKIAIHAPLLLEQQYLQFSSSLRQNQQTYILSVDTQVLSDETVSRSVLQKWRIVLYGLQKGDFAYRRCLGFEVKNENEPYNHQEGSSNIANNSSYHEMKGVTQYHSCFQQIEKDLNRTFSFQQHTQLAFENVLKRIANHFPSMGYTQGVNFVVGYLLLQGYSEADTFWMFAHMAMNKHFLLLGLYEDGFPLANIFTLLFKNMLQRTDSQLFNHIYSNLMLDDSMWIFKWFITLFIYSFPLETIKYVWDVLIELGSIGLVYFSLSLVTHLKSSILQCQDPCDISEFFQSIKDLATFNNLVNIKQVVVRTYEMRLMKQDLEGVQLCKQSFYKDYYKLIQADMDIKSFGKLKPVIATSPRWKVKEDGVANRLHLWYVKLLEERVEFVKKRQEDKTIKEEIPAELKDDYEEMQKSVKILTDKIIQNESQRSLKQIPSQDNHDYFTELIMDKRTRTVETEIRDHQDHSLEDAENINKIPTRISYDIEQEIDELEGESDSNNCQQLEPSHEHIDSRIHKSSPQDSSIQLDKDYPEEFTPKMNKMNIEDSKKILEHHRQKQASMKAKAKANNLNINPPQMRSGFGLAGQNILGNLSVTNSQYSSAQSKNTSYKPKKQKQNIISRYNNNNKTKIEALSQLSHPSNELSSDHESSIDRRTEKDSISGFTQRENVKERPSFGKDEGYLERKTQRDLMVISHGPEKKNSHGIQKNSGSEIQIFHGEGLFKKKKRTYNRNSVITSITRELPSSMNININDQIKAEKSKHRTYNDEESLESILQLSAVRKTRKPNLSNPSNVLFEIVSIK